MLAMGWVFAWVLEWAWKWVFSSALASEWKWASVMACESVLATHRKRRSAWG